MWETQNQVNTLLIQRRERPGGREEFQVYPFYRVNNVASGHIFLRPLSLSGLENAQLVFHELEFIAPVAQPSKVDGDTALIGCGPHYLQRAL